MWELKTPVVVLFLLGILHLACLASSANCFSHATVSYLNIMQSMQSCAWEDLVSKVGCIPSKAGRGHYPDKTMHDHGVATENWKICIDDLFPVHHLFLQFFSRPCCNPQLCSTRPSRPSSRILAARIDDYVLFQHPKLVFLFFCHNIKRNGAGSVADSGSEKLEIVLSHLYNPAQHVLYPTQCVLHSRHHFVWTKRNMFCTTWNMFFCVCFASWTHTHTQHVISYHILHALNLMWKTPLLFQCECLKCFYSSDCRLERGWNGYGDQASSLQRVILGVALWGPWLGEHLTVSDASDTDQDVE